MTAIFLYGTLCHLPLLTEVLGRVPDPRPAVARDEQAFWAAGQPFPILVPTPGETVEGLLLENVTPAEFDRLAFYETGFATGRITVEPEGSGAPVEALVFRPSDEAGRWIAGPLWSLADWAERWGETTVEGARDMLARFGHGDSTTLQARFPMLLARGAARSRARPGGPTTLRHHARAEDVEIAELRHPYENFFAVEEYDLRWRRFDGSMSAVHNRAVFIMADAVVVLPYDPVRDRVLLVEQFRMGPFARGDSQPWLLEAIAGRIDGGEAPEEAARREAEEEAGLVLSKLIEAPQTYASCGAVSEYLYNFVGLADLPDGVAQVAGLDEEGEDIRGHLMSFDRMMTLIGAGEITALPLVALALWLAAQRPALRAAADNGTAGDGTAGNGTAGN